MIADQPAKLLISQIASELTAHQLYMGISAYFTRESLNAWAKHFRDQAIEEAEHGWKIVNFLIDNDVTFALPRVGGAPTTYKSAREALEVALTSERRVSQEFEALGNAARDAKDNRSLQFVQWFIDEQVEEERTAAALVDLVDSGINLFDAEQHLERVTRE
jgi:bacterioferritin B